MESPEDIKTGVAFSGGGVRSAAFCSGVLRRLLQKRVAIDYLSSVSGGGYTAASYMEWKYRNGKKDDPAWHKEYFENLRKHINPLCDCFNPVRGIVDGVIVIFLLIFLSVGLTLLRAFAFVMPIAFVVDSLFGNILRDQFTCHEENANKTIQGIPKDELLKLCIPKFGPNMEVMFQLTFSWLSAFVLTFYLSTIVRLRTPKYVLKFLYQLTGFGSAMIFLPWILELYSSFTPPWARQFLIGAVFIIWLFFPSLREKAFFALGILVYAYCTKWTIFKTPLASVEYTDNLYWIFVWVSAVLMWLHPYMGVLQMYGAHYFVEWRLKRAYFSSKSRMANTYFSKALTMADLEGIEPEYKTNVTINQWRKTNNDFEKDCEILTFSSKSLERIDRKEKEKEFRTEGFIKPKDVRLSSAMTTSASAISYDDGELQDAEKSFREIRVILGLGFGNNLVAQIGLTKIWMSSVVTMFIQIFFGVIVIAIPVALYFGALNDWDLWKRVLLIVLLSYFVVLALIAVIPTEDTGCGENVTRWCIINVLHVRLIRAIFGITHVGSTPPPVLSLSDGGHTENLGLLPLLKLRLPRIVAVNGGALEIGDDYSTDLLKAIKQARKKLRCSFTGVSGRDIEEDIRDHFVEKEKGEQPRSYRFKVQYFKKDDFENKCVGEGEILMLMPRHPDDGMRQFQNCKWSDFDGDVKLDLDESAWGPGPALKASEVDRLSGCFCECCHTKPFNFIMNSLFSGFPFHSSFNQMFTPAQFSAYHREGYHACLEAKAADFLGKCQNAEVITTQPQRSDVTVIDVAEFGS